MQTEQNKLRPCLFFCEPQPANMEKSTGILLPLFFLQQLCVCGQGVGLAPIELAPIPCNDKAVEKLSRLAVTYINEDRTDGYKFALNRIGNVHLHAQGPAGNVYYLDLDVLETKCHVGNPKPWKRCDIRAFMETQISGNCNTTILHTAEGYSYLYSYDCTLVPDPPEKLQQTCPTCPLLLPVDSPEAVQAAAVTLTSYKRQSTLGAGLGVKTITRAASQVIPVKASFVEYTVQECPEGLTNTGTCQRLSVESDTETAGFCAGSMRGDVDIHPDVQVSCEMYKVQNVDILRPMQPQGHDLQPDLTIPTRPSLIYDPQPVPSDPTLPPAVLLPEVPAAPFVPAPFDPVPFVPPVLSRPSNPLSSSSSESDESSDSSAQRQPGPPPPPSQPFVSSSEEIGGPVARRPPLNFRYKTVYRKKRQALPEAAPPHSPIFMSVFPSGSSPFRSCPGPSRYTTV